MPHPDIVNQTPFVVSPLFLTDNDLRPVLTPLVRATFSMGRDGSLRVHDKQMAAQLSGQFWGDPQTSSYKFEPECAFFKPATDVVLIGHARAPTAGTTELAVGLRVGSMQKVVKVLGDRVMSRIQGRWTCSAPQEWEAIPLIYERAFGGWDRTDPDPERHCCEPRNPVGVGFRLNAGGSDFVMPNIEDPAHPFTGPGQAPPPAGFGFTGPAWQPRASFAGTYDKAWSDQRKPLLPSDFDMRFFNAASPGLSAAGYLAGDEDVVVANASVRGQWAFQLPAVAAPVCECELQGRRRARITTQLDTVIIDADQHQVHLLWRGHLHLASGPHDLVVMTVSSATHRRPAVVLAA